MKTAYEFCNRFWSTHLLEPHKAGLEKIMVLELPQDLLSFDKVDKNSSIVIMEKASVYNSLQVIRRGFSHCLQAERADLKKELLTACLMLIRPDSLVEREIPFFFKGFSEKVDWKNSDHAILIEGRKPEDRESALSSLEQFFKLRAELKSISDLALQIMDELYSNALFHAPSPSEPKDRPIHIFAAYDKEQLLIGCSDGYGRLNRDQLTSHLLKAFSTHQTQPNLGEGGAGLGLKMAIENSANFYVSCVKNKRTVIGCGLLLKGRKLNLAETKHFHFTFAP